MNKNELSEVQEKLDKALTHVKVSYNSPKGTDISEAIGYMLDVYDSIEKIKREGRYSELRENIEERIKDLSENIDLYFENENTEMGAMEVKVLFSRIDELYYILGMINALEEIERDDL